MTAARHQNDAAPYLVAGSSCAGLISSTRSGSPQRDNTFLRASVGSILAGSDLLLVHAPGATRPMTPWRAGILRRYAAARVMKTSVSWSPTPSLNVVSVQRGEQAWTVTVDSRQPTSCPGCGTHSKSRHSAYSRTLRDLSAQGAPVIINARLARWRCRNQRCDRRIFSERLPCLRGKPVTCRFERGPSVTRTASASRVALRRIFSRAAERNRTCLYGILAVLAYEAGLSRPKLINI